MAGLGTASPSWSIDQRVAVRGRRWTVQGVEPGVDCQALRLRPDGDSPGSTELTLLVPFDRVQPIEDVATSRVVPVRRLLHELRRLAAQQMPADGLRSAAATGIRLIPYQLEPALAILRGHASRVLIGDSVGLGKTIEAGLLIRELHERSESFRALVLVPAGLREQWLDELRTRFGLRGILADTAWLTSTTRELPPGLNPWTLPGIYVASQDLVKRAEVLAPLEDVTWDLCVLDEAHVATSRSDRRAAADALARRARRVVLLTATPHPDSPAEFEALCRIGRVDPDEEPMLVFRRTRADVADSGSRRTSILPVRVTAPERRMHELLDRYTRAIWQESGRRGDDLARLASIVLRKRALSSAGSLAASIARRMELLAHGPALPLQLALPLGDEDPLEDAQPDAALAVPGLADARREQRWLGAIAFAARNAARTESKMALLLRLLRRIREPAIVFTEFRDTLARLHRALAAAGRALVVLHGGMAPAERGRVQRLFNEQPLTLLATDAASEGLNLHGRCRVVIHYELPWSAARLEQRVGRVDRLGQQRRVHEIALVAADTAERLVLAPLLARSARARRAGTDPPALVRSLTESRVAALVMDGAPEPASPAGDHARSDTTWMFHTDLRRDAEAEARRLEAQRHDLTATQKCGTARRTGMPIAEIASRRSGLQAGWLLVHRVTLASRSGRPVAVAAPVLAVRTSGRQPARHRAYALRELAADLASLLPADATRHLHRTIRSIVESAAVAHERTLCAERRREEAISRSRASTARRLVQAGLFDRRALKEIADREARRGALIAEAERRRRERTRSMLSVDLAVAAMLRVADRRRHR